MTLSISVWSDIACPWCWVGKRRLEAALRQLTEDGVKVDAAIIWRSFELDQRRKNPNDRTPYVTRLAKKYGLSDSRAQDMLDTMTRTGQKEGIVFDFPRAVPANTSDAHRLLHWARASDKVGRAKCVQDKLKEAFMKAHFEQGVDIGLAGSLLSIVDGLGLNVDSAAAVLSGSDFASAVREDEEEAQRRGVSGVPYFAIGRFGVSGAQPAQTLADTIKRALAEQLESEREEQGRKATLSEGALCTPETC